jgi:hypothetical protein
MLQELRQPSRSFNAKPKDYTAAGPSSTKMLMCSTLPTANWATPRPTFCSDIFGHPEPEDRLTSVHGRQREACEGCFSLSDNTGLVPVRIREMIVMYFLLFYEVVDDYIERRRAFRVEHLGLAQEAKDRGELVLAGAYADPPDGAALVFRADDDSVVRAFRRPRPLRPRRPRQEMGHPAVDSRDWQPVTPSGSEQSCHPAPAPARLLPRPANWSVWS